MLQNYKLKFFNTFKNRLEWVLPVLKINLMACYFKIVMTVDLRSFVGLVCFQKLY